MATLAEDKQLKFGRNRTETTHPSSQTENYKKYRKLTLEQYPSPCFLQVFKPETSQSFPRGIPPFKNDSDSSHFPS